MRYSVTTGPNLAGNALLAGDRRAADRQTPEEHEALLDISTLPDYRTVMLMPPGPQKMMALQALQAQAELREAESPKYWKDEQPRRPLFQSSSFIGDVEEDPASNILSVRLGDKIYTYPGVDPHQAAEFVNAPSMEKYFNNILKRS